MTNKAEIVRDDEDKTAIRVECIVEDGAVEVAIFYGPSALPRATHYANAWYGEYDVAVGLR